MSGASGGAGRVSLVDLYQAADPGMRAMLDKELDRLWDLDKHDAHMEIAGLVVAIVFLIGIISASVWLIRDGFTTGGSILGSVNVTTVVGLLIYDRQRVKSVGGG